VGKSWHSYLTSVLDPLILPPYVVADLSGRRWRIEEAFNTVKRLLGLSYLWTGSLNGIKLQIWGTWLFYAVLVDLGDAVADELSLPCDRISLEMICGCIRLSFGTLRVGEASPLAKRRGEALRAVGEAFPKGAVSACGTSRSARLQRALHQAIEVFTIFTLLVTRV
jgi:hypothetical protein